MENPVIIFGAKGLGRAALEIFESNDNVVYGFLDDDESLHSTELDNIPILGGTSDTEYLRLLGSECEAFLAVDDNTYKSKLVKSLNTDYSIMPVNAIHGNALISRSADIGHGNFINSGASIGAGAKLGSHCVLHSNSTVQHDVRMGDFVQIGAGATVSANVELGDNVFVGSGVTIVPGIKIGKNARIGAGSVVVANVENGKTVFGNPAKEVQH